MPKPHTPTRIHTEQGQTMAEYGVLLALVTITVVTSAALLGGAISTVLQHVATFLGA
jgi:Flp pilus assembly pilin Flp